MTGKQQRKLKMYLVLQVFLEKHVDITNTLPNFNKFSNDLQETIKQIQTYSTEQQYKTVAQTESKKECRIKLESLMFDYSNKIQAYALFVQNTQLLGEVKLTKSQLIRSTELNLIATARMLYTQINKYLHLLENYQLNTETQAAFKTTIDIFQNKISQVLNKKVEQIEYTKQIALAFKQGDNAIMNIKALIEILHTTQPAFYANYINTCKIEDKGGRLQAIGNVVDAMSGKPMEAVTLNFVAKDKTTATIQKTTARKGGFKIKNIDEGIYQVQVTKTGYVSQQLTAVISSGTLCRIYVKLELV